MLKINLDLVSNVSYLSEHVLHGGSQQSDLNQLEVLELQSHMNCCKKKPAVILVEQKTWFLLLLAHHFRES